MKLTKDELYSLVKSLATINVTELTVKNDDLIIKIKHGTTEVVQAQGAKPVAATTAPIAHDEEMLEEEVGTAVRAPIHGTFYEASGPEKPPYTKVGDKVKKGDAICILEAMKMMNTVDMPEDGVICAIEVENEDIVDAGQVLVRYLTE
ncbi:MAG: acetyl-CoA carboxylase, biotin carboxyl carrier protein [Clostridiales bacterium]|nr:acetyl-CoA carboxylase, biotin carboxyl carrier protein [Clostridiales bacterium]